MKRSYALYIAIVLSSSIIIWQSLCQPLPYHLQVQADREAEKSGTSGELGVSGQELSGDAAPPVKEASNTPLSDHGSQSGLTPMDMVSLEIGFILLLPDLLMRSRPGSAASP